LHLYDLLNRSNIISCKKKPRPQPGFFAFQEMVVSRISNAENTRPQPAATAAVTAADVFAGDGIHSAFNPDIELARI
jgi:hypothetical protein